MSFDDSVRSHQILLLVVQSLGCLRQLVASRHDKCELTGGSPMMVVAKGFVAIPLVVVAVGAVQKQGQDVLRIRGTGVVWNLGVLNR